MYARLSGGNDTESTPAFQSQHNGHGYGAGPSAARSASITELTPRVSYTSHTYDNDSKTSPGLAHHSRDTGAATSAASGQRRASLSNSRYAYTARTYAFTGTYAVGVPSDSVSSAPATPVIASRRRPENHVHAGRHSLDAFGSARVTMTTEISTSSHAPHDASHFFPDGLSRIHGSSSSSNFRDHGQSRVSYSQQTVLSHKPQENGVRSLPQSPSPLRRKGLRSVTPVRGDSFGDLKLNSKSGVSPLVVTNHPISSSVPYRDHLSNERTLLAWIRQAFVVYTLGVAIAAVGVASDWTSEVLILASIVVVFFGCYQYEAGKTRYNKQGVLHGRSMEYFVYLSVALLVALGATGFILVYYRRVAEMMPPVSGSDEP